MTSPSLRTALQLSAADRRWIDFVTQTVLDTWDPENPSRPKNMGYAGSEDSIRMQFEEYILSLLASMAYQIYHEDLEANDIPASVANIPANFPDPGDNAADFNPEFMAMWRATNNYALFNRLTQGNRIFDIIEPRHPTSGGLNVDDLQRRFAQGVADLHLDERVREGREQLGRTWQSGRERVEAGFRGVWAEVERARQQRQAKRRSRSRSIADDQQQQAPQKEKTAPGTLSNESSNSSWTVVDGEPVIAAPAVENPPSSSTSSEKRPMSPPRASSESGSTAAGAWSAALRDRAAKVDISQLQASARGGAAKAGTYLSSWGSWARDRMQQQQQQQSGQGKEGASGAAPGQGKEASQQS